MQRSAVEKLHHHVVPTAVRADFIGLNDIRMNQACGESSLFEEHRDVRLVVAQLRLQLFHDQELAEATRPLGGREVNVSHPTSRQLSDEVILPNLGRYRRL